MDTAIGLTIIGVIATILFGAPAWFTYLRKRSTRKKNDQETLTLDRRSSDQLSLFNKAFGDIIASFLEKEGLSEKDLASLLDDNLSIHTVSSWKKGITFPAEHLAQLLDILGIIDSDFDLLALKYIQESELNLLKKHSGEKKSLQINIALLRSTFLLRDGNRTNPIYVIAPYSSLTSQFRERSSPNYIFIDNLGDRDSLLELTITLARLYQISPITFHHSKDFSSDLLENDLILLGGIGYPNEPNNHVAQSLIDERKIPLSYDDNRLIIGDKAWSSEYIDGSLAFDIGLFASLKNPWNKKKRVIIFQGIHTSGVLGSVRAFSLNTAAVENHRLAHQLYGNSEYCAVFQIRLFDGRPVIPIIKESDFIAL